MIVLDCCAAVDIVRGTTKGLALKSLLLTDEIVITSELFHAELIYAFQKYVDAALMDKAQALTLIKNATDLVDEFVPLQENYVEAFHQAVVSKHSSYDMLYLTLARRNAATLVTLDKKLNSLCEELGVDHLYEISL